METKVYQPIAIIGIPKNPVHVPDCIIKIYTTLDKLANSGDNIVDAQTITAQEGNADKLQSKQEGMAGGATDKTQMRDSAYAVCYNDRQADMMMVQIKANNIADPIQAAALIKRNGFELKKDPSAQVNPEIQIKNKDGFPGTILASVKAPKTTKQFSIDWEYSYDNGESWVHSNSTGICEREIKNLKLLSAVIVRARFIIASDDPMGWMISNSINI